jgi:hypothetical protein
MEGIREVVWCDHLKGDTVPLVGGRSVLWCHFTRSFWVVPEEGKLKMVCNECWDRSATIV